jgi:hypothetical protein
MFMILKKNQKYELDLFSIIIFYVSFEGRKTTNKR